MAKMTRKHYREIANIIRSAALQHDPTTAEYIAREMAMLLASDNPNFSRRQFLDACEVDKEAWT